MADLALTRFNLKPLIVGALASAEGLLAEIAKYAYIPEGLPVGTLTANYMTAFDVTTATKGGTSMVADAGNTSASTLTTTQVYLPVEFYDYEVGGVDDRQKQFIARKAANAVMASAEGILADAFVAASITTNTQTLVSPNDNFADLADALPKLLALMGQVAATGNAGKLPDWIALGSEAYGRVLGANPVTYGGFSIIDKRPYFHGVPLFPITPATASGMNGDGDPCGWVGCWDAVNFAISSIEEGSLRRRDNGLYALDLSYTYTYGLNEVSLQMGEILNAVT